MSGPAETLRLGGARAKRAGDLETAERAFRAALALAPDDPRVRVGLAEVLLSQGRYAEAWPLAESRLEVPELGSAPPPLEQPEWRGQDVAGKRLLVIGEQGAGDQIMYARFAPILKARGADVTLLSLPSLSRLFAASLGVAVFAMSGKVEVPDPDLWVLTASLPARFGVTPGTVPAAPYLAAEPRAAGGRIGVVARGNPRHPFDATRSLPPPEAERLLALPGAVDLSPAATGAADFLDTARVVSGLDLVVTVDTSVAHLAGALGTPVWILLPVEGCDWRWMDRREDSPWYPSARLIRQPRPGDWRTVLDTVERELAEFSR